EEHADHGQLRRQQQPGQQPRADLDPLLGAHLLLAFWNRSSCSLPRLMAASMPSLAVFLPAQTPSNSSSMIVRIWTKLPRRTPRDLSVVLRIICVTATSVPGFSL